MDEEIKFMLKAQPSVSILVMVFLFVQVLSQADDMYCDGF